MKTIIYILGILSLIVIMLLLSPVLGMVYVLLAPLVLLIVIFVALIKNATKTKKKGDDNKC